MARLARISRAIDPETRDWVIVNGQRKVEDTLITRVLFLVALEYNSSPAFPGIGSKLHEIKKITEDIDVVISQEIERTLRPMVDEGELVDLLVTTTVTGRERIDPSIVTKVSFRDAAGQPQSTQFEVQL